MMVAGWFRTAVLMGTCVLPMVGQAHEVSGDMHGPTVVSFDWGSTDTLEALGLESQLVGLPYQAAPAYVAHLLDDRVDVGGLKTPDAEAVSISRPELILVTGRQGEAGMALGEVAEVMDVSLGEGDFFAALRGKVRNLAERYDALPRAETALHELQAYIDEARNGLPESASVMVVTHNDGHYSLRHAPVVSELLALSPPAVPGDVTPVVRGTRSFTPMTPDTMARMKPDAVLVVDRSAAIGAKPLEPGALSQALAAEGADDIAVVTLTPGLWYLSGGGLKSVRAQVDEVVEALDQR